jgi:hypothetical protein
MLNPVLLPSLLVTVIPLPPFEYPEMTRGMQVVVGTGVGTIDGCVLVVGRSVGPKEVEGECECVGITVGTGDTVGTGTGTLVGLEITPSSQFPVRYHVCWLEYEEEDSRASISSSVSG